MSSKSNSANDPTKHWYKIDNIFQTIRPIFRSLKWLGFLPFTVDDSAAANANGNALLRMRPSDVLLLAGWQLYIGSMFFSGWIQSMQEVPMSKIMISFSLLSYFVVSALTSVVQLRLASARAKIERLLRMVKFADDLLDQLSHGVNHSRQHRWLVGLLVASFLSSAGFVLTEWQISWLVREQTVIWQEFFYVGAAIFFYAIRIVSLCPLVAFIGGLLAFRSRYRKLNDAFRFHFEQQQQQEDDAEVDNNVDEVDVQERLRTIAVCHDQLTEAVQLFCDIFNLQIITTCGSYTIFCTFAMYTTVSWVVQGDNGTQLITVFYVSAFLHFSTHILPIMKLGSDVRKEGMELAVLVHRVINHTAPAVISISNSLRLLSRQLQHHTPRVSCGMFSFDWTLCFSIFSGTATYTMIMTQFELAVPRFFMGALIPNQQLQQQMPNATANLFAPVT